MLLLSSCSASAASVRGVGHQELQAPESALLPPPRLQLLPGDRREDLLPGRGEQERPRAWPLSGEDRESPQDHGADHEDSHQVDICILLTFPFIIVPINIHYCVK